MIIIIMRGEFMINSIELEIIKKYINKDKQERIIWEFGNSKKRDNIMLERFAGPDIFNKNCLQLLEYMPPDVMEKYLFQLSRAKDIYFIGQDYIGELPLKQAINRANTGEICIIYCGNGIGYYQGERECGNPPRFLLLQKKEN